MFNKILKANRGEIACRIIKTARLISFFTVLTLWIPSIPAHACAWADGPPSASLLSASNVIVVSGSANLDPKKGRGDIVVTKVVRGKKLVSNALQFSPYDPDFNTMACGPWKWTTDKSRLTGVYFLKQIDGTSHYLIYQFKSKD